MRLQILCLHDMLMRMLMRIIPKANFWLDMLVQFQRMKTAGASGEHEQHLNWFPDGQRWFVSCCVSKSEILLDNCCFAEFLLLHIASHCFHDVPLMFHALFHGSTSICTRSRRSTIGSFCGCRSGGAEFRISSPCCRRLPLSWTAHVRRKLCSQFFVKRTGHRMPPAFLLLNMAENLPDSELTANQQTMNMDMSQNWVPQNPIVQTCLKHQVPHENQTRFWVSTILRPAQFPWPNGCQSHPQRSRNSALCWDDPTTLGRPPSAATRVWLGWSLGWTVDHWLKSQAICKTEHGETKVQQC